MKPRQEVHWTTGFGAIWGDGSSVDEKVRTTFSCGDVVPRSRVLLRSLRTLYRYLHLLRQSVRVFLGPGLPGQSWGRLVEMSPDPAITPFRVVIDRYRIVVKAALPNQRHDLSRVSSFALKAVGQERRYMLCFRREGEIRDPWYDPPSDIIYIDYSIEESSTVLQLLQSGERLVLELKIQDGSFWVELWTDWKQRTGSAA